MLSMVNMRQRYRTLEERCRRGSLPLKKRRLLIPEEGEHQQDVILKKLGVSSTDASKLSALTLVAAAASSSFVDSELPASDTASVASSVASSLLKSTNHASEDLSPTPSARRVLRPPLATPLPGGCHGRTSRNNSYCRRQPCYNGSKYCKLHYQHYIVAGIRTPLDEETDSLQCELTTTVCPSVSQQREQLSSSNQHQDKRFMGGSDETRCHATTTRGRPCSYVSVNDTKYCYLHADYDTNPPPRRGGGSKTSELNAHTLRALEAGAPTALVSHTTPTSVSSEASFASSRSQPTAAKTPTTPKASRRGGQSKLAERHADSPWPLLSMISTDQWKGKSVRVATGPLKGRLGSVEKWGNGWVSVRLPNMGLHNRRSFELYLESTNASADSPRTNVATTTDTGSAVVVGDAEIQDDPSPVDLQASNGSDTETDHESSADYSVVVPATPRSTGAAVSSYETPKTTSNLVGHAGVGNQPCFPTQVTPMSTKPARQATGLPLSLMLEGPERSPLLYGTAALERGRRTIHRPARYDEAIKKSKKRGRIESSS